MTPSKINLQSLSLSPGTFLVDSHCHLDMEAYQEDFDQMLTRAWQVGIGAIVSVGIDIASSCAAIRLAHSHLNIYATVGIHPHNCATLTDADYDELRRLARQPKVVAYGEIGMDLAKKYAPPAVQRDHWCRQARLAKELELPIIIHDREAHDEILAVLDEEGPFPRGGIMHCFSGDLDLARQVIASGFHISIPGIVTFPKAETLREVVAHIDLEWLLLETDGPYLAPVPMRGKRNEPSYLVHVARMIAEIKGIALDEVAAATTANCCRLFGVRIRPDVDR